VGNLLIGGAGVPNSGFSFFSVEVKGEGPRHKQRAVGSGCPSPGTSSSQEKGMGAHRLFLLGMTTSVFCPPFFLDIIGQWSILKGMARSDLAKWRKEWGLTQKRLAKDLGVDVMTVSRWERGVRSIPPHIPLALETLENRMKEDIKNGSAG
jgi:DNA-binding XRE family transcriptional regulator